ncbi:39S ribosomal protein L16, mitochondrial [Malassezia pachydermatis]|uniref:Mrpl16-mitochondrial ribosomal large subunit n=1 Tax=Malassezia pachydermatis TaxID=77020 RepID=A0A0M9VPG7_9BASI|nr:mrpl16-mitochondrial ribosomal large subunit [Malassezia pachydermatis]KOS14232.1 mrpl16-mitochondrial ribosomal large subunit [Malassezia pachydermatis]
MSFRSFLGGTRASIPAVVSSWKHLLSEFTWRPSNIFSQVRFASNLGPRRTKYRKSHKGRVSFPIGGSVKGTTVTQGMYGIRTLEPCRITATQLTAAETALKRKLKVVRGSQVFMRVFPDVPVCVKGNETRMGKGKGSFEYWACRVPVGRVLFEIGGHVEVRPEVAKDALRLAAAKLPIRTEFITASTPPRLGREVNPDLSKPKLGKQP